MLRKLLGIWLLAGVAALPAHAQPVQLMPGVTSERQVEFTPHGPVGFTVITTPAPGSSGGLYTLGPVLAGGTVGGARESVANLERDAAETSTSVGINGDFASGTGNHVTGIVVASGAYEHSPTAGRVSMAVDSTGLLHVARLSFAGTWQGTGQRRPVAAINQPPGKNQVVLYTPAWGASTPNAAAAVVFEPFPAASANTGLTATVASTATGSVPIPSDGAVLVATGTAAAKLQAEAPQGGSVTIQLILPPSLDTVVDAFGGGPMLVRNGVAVFHTDESFAASDLADRDARAAVGQLADGQIILVAVDGEQPGFSVGMTTYELAQTMARLGARTAAALAYGKSVTAAFDGQLLNRPVTAGGAAVKEALLVQYFGVYAPPVSAPLVDDASTVEQLTYKVVRPSTVTAAVIGPDGVQHVLDSGSRVPGTYHFTWSSYNVEGTWHWNVNATDDLGRASVADETFQYDLTLSGLSAASSNGVVNVRFSLSRPANATLKIETRLGAVVATLPSVSLPAGSQSLSWDGTTAAGAKAPPGAYVARVTTVSTVGTMDLTAPFTLHAISLHG